MTLADGDGAASEGARKLHRLRERWLEGPAATSRDTDGFRLKMKQVVPATVSVLAADGCDDDTARRALELLSEVSAAASKLRDHTGDDHGALAAWDEEVAVLRQVDRSGCTRWRAWAVRSALMLPGGGGMPLPPDWDPWPQLEAMLDIDTVRLDSILPDAPPSGRREAASGTELTLSLQAVLAGDTDPSVRFSLAENPVVAPEILAALAEDDDHKVVLAVAGNPGTPAATLDHMARDVDDVGVRVAVIRNTAVGPETLGRLAHDDSETVRIWAQGHPSCPMDTVLRSARQGDTPAVRNPVLGADELGELAANPRVPAWAVADNPNCPPDLLRHLVRRPHTGGGRSAAAAAAGHPNCPSDLADELLDSADREVAMTVAERQPLAPEQFARLVHDGTARFPADHWIWSVVANPHCPQELIRELDAAHRGLGLTMYLVPDPATSPDRVGSLPSEQQWELARNPATPPELLRALAEIGARPAVMANPAAAPELLLELVAGPDLRDFWSLRDNPGIPRWLPRTAASSANPIETLANLALQLHLRAGGRPDPALADAVSDLAPDWEGNPMQLLQAAIASATDSTE